ncbi:hypothetical protein BN946_scf184725.g3 [Trametes cinnabarina]|uniref:C2H2-type domain-containing protein n=1 Tax=Pycnoporus cinnabarinus TaxID=5643 RepID=A0A060T0R3_PYCCI|nr:hypothetical protein BN946_scf184725.g3 [Trametes cinnabarina]
MNASEPALGELSILSPRAALAGIMEIGRRFKACTDPDYQQFGQKLSLCLAGLADEYGLSEGPQLKGLEAAPIHYPQRVPLQDMPLHQPHPPPAPGPGPGPSSSSSRSRSAPSLSPSSSSLPTGGVTPVLPDKENQENALTGKGKEAEDREWDIPSDDTRLTDCCWYGCKGVIAAADRMYTHIQGMHIGGKKQNPRALVRCLWTGCKQKKEIPVASLKRHIEVTHLQMKSLTCRVCGVTKRYDAYKMTHGPARDCLFGTAIPEPFGQPTPIHLPSLPPMQAYSGPGDSGEPGPSRRSPANDRHARAMNVQQRIAYPPSEARSIARRVQASFQPLPWSAEEERDVMESMLGWIDTQVASESNSSTLAAAAPFATASTSTQWGFLTSFPFPTSEVPEGTQRDSAGELDMPENLDWTQGMDENYPPRLDQD